MSQGTGQKVNFKTYTVRVYDNEDIVWLDGEGAYHREDGPAVEWANGGKNWYKHGVRHREDGPAVENSRRKEWWIDGKRHREDGPAIEYADGTIFYFLNGVSYNEEQFDKEANSYVGKIVEIDGKKYKLVETT